MKLQSFTLLMFSLLALQGNCMISSYPGILCSIEGIDGSGKTTLAQKLSKKIQQEISDHVVCTREPGATELGKLLRSLLANRTAPTCTKAEFLLFASDRAQHFETIVIPQLQQGTIIISDRMADSSLAYQGYLKGLDIDMIQRINQWCMQNVTPDIVFYLKIDRQSAIDRIKKERGFTTKFEEEYLDKMELLVNGFETIFSTRNNVIILDALQDIDDLTQQAFDHIKRLWNEKQNHAKP